MAITLYDLCVPSFLQTLGAMQGVLERGLKHCAETQMSPEELVEARIYPNMLPLRFQIISLEHHSIGAIEGARAKTFSPPTRIEPLDYAGLQNILAESIAAVMALTPEEVNGFEGKDLLFQMGEMKLPFTADGFIQSFSLPNFYFHATTAYDILRLKGVPLAKRHFLGQMRLKA